MVNDVYNNSVRMIHPNWEVRWAYDKAYNRAVDIVQDVGIDKRTVKPIEGGLYSSELGSATDTDKELREYTCYCGKLHGRHREGDICEECGTIVKEEYGVDLDKFGWINISPYFIIQPSAHAKLASLIGPTGLERILNYNVNIDAEGMLDRSIVKTNAMKNQPFANIGILEFKRRYEEIIAYYARIKPKKQQVAEYLLKIKSRVFSTKIPVFSSLLRPAYASGKRKMFSYDKINSGYSTILTNTRLLQRGSAGKMKLSALSTLYSIQFALNETYDLIFSSKLVGKYKEIRKGVLRNKMSFSGRAVATSLAGPLSGVNHTVLPYKMFLELYELEILNCMMRGIGSKMFMTMTIFELKEYLQSVLYSDNKDESVYAIMAHLVKNHKQGLWVIINRNPSMDMLSSQYFKVVDVFDDPRKKTIRIQSTSLRAFNGDHDGDEFNVFSPKELCVHMELLNSFDPRKMLIDRTGDNIFNRDFNILKDHATALISFMTPLEYKLGKDYKKAEEAIYG